MLNTPLFYQKLKELISLNMRTFTNFLKTIGIMSFKILNSISTLSFKLWKTSCGISKNTSNKRFTNNSTQKQMRGIQYFSIMKNKNNIKQILNHSNYITLRIEQIALLFLLILYYSLSQLNILRKCCHIFNKSFLQNTIFKYT